MKHYFSLGNDLIPRAALLLLLTLSCQQVYSADIAREVRTAGDSAEHSDGGYFELGLGLSVTNDVTVDEPFDADKTVDVDAIFSINGAYRLKNFFIEFDQGTFDGINIGYTLWHNERWSIDLLALSGGIKIGESEDDEISAGELSEAQRNDRLTDRDRIYSGAGFRLTGFVDDYIFQYRLVTDYLNGVGITSSLRAGRHWQIRNWNFHAIAGVAYASAETVNHFVGITPIEATEAFPAYAAENSFIVQGEIGLAYPLNEHWVLRSSIRVEDIPSSSSDSPLIKDTYAANWSTTISYVF